MNTTCENCGAPFKPNPHGRKPRFCTRTCQVQALNRKPSRSYGGRKAAS